MHARSISTAVAVLVLAIAIFTPISARAQLGTSKWSLELATDVGSFDEIAFAVRCHSGATSAFRLALNANLSRVDGTGDLTNTGFPDQDASIFTDSHQLALAIHWMKFATIRNGLSATFATGPSVRSLRVGSRQGTGMGTTSFVESEFRLDETTFGWEFLLGAEWFFTPRLSLGGSTGFRGEIGSGSQVQIIRSGNGPTYDVNEFQVDTDVSRITTQSARIQLVAYF